MSNKTRERFLPVALVMAVAVIGVVAFALALTSAPRELQAHGGSAGDCSTDLGRAIHDALSPNDPCPTSTMDPAMTPMPTEEPSEAEVKSSSTSASSTVELKLTIAELSMPVAVGGSIVLYIEDDFAEPDSISAGDVYFVSEPAREVTGDGGRVYTTIDPVIATSDYFTADKKDISIQVFVPDMCRNATDDCEGDDGLMMGDKITMVVTKGAGIKNPSEEGTHSTGYSVLPATHTGSVPNPAQANLNTVATLAKIGLSDVDNKRGYEMTVTGSGFNDGTTASAYVLHIPGSDGDMASKYLWNALDCAEMNAAFGYMGTDAKPKGTSPCTMYDGLSAEHKMAVDGEDFFTKGYGEAQLCNAIIRDGTKAGGALVGSDDKVAVTFEVTAPTFGPGNTNHICMADGENRRSSTDVEDFNLEPSIKVVPSSVATGDTVNVFAQDYQNMGQGFNRLKIAGETIPMSFVQSSRNIGMDGSGTVTFEIPGGLEGTLRIDAQWGMTDGEPAKCDLDMPSPCISKNSKITIAGADLNASKTDVLPNETVTITGGGFGSQTCIPASNITLDNVPVMVDEESISTSGGCMNMSGVEVSNSGQFVATIVMWPGVSGTNPTLIPGTHELSVEDNHGFGGSVSMTIAEPTIMVTPDVAGPRDYITITGANWPVDNPEGASTPAIMVEVDDGRVRPYTLFADAVGRVVQEHRVYRNVPIPSDVQVKMTHGDVAKIGSFSVPASTIEVTPGEGQPGDTVSLSSGNMPVYSEVDYIEIGGTRYNDPGVNTDRDGNVTVEDVLIPGLDPGIYSVVINVDGTIAIGEVTVLAESSARGAPAELPGALESLGDNLVAIFHFDDVGKEWSFYDPRPEFADLNTLTELVNGEAYWILVSETVEDVVLNNKVRSLTCRGSDCWNLEVW